MDFVDIVDLKQEEFLKGHLREDIEIPDKIKPVCKPNLDDF